MKWLGGMVLGAAGVAAGFLWWAYANRDNPNVHLPFHGGKASGSAQSPKVVTATGAGYRGAGGVW